MTIIFSCRSNAKKYIYISQEHDHLFIGTDQIQDQGETIKPLLITIRPPVYFTLHLPISVSEGTNVKHLHQQFDTVGLTH